MHRNIEFFYQHRLISWTTLLLDIKKLIEIVAPSAIICTGYDSHRDHRQCEIAVMDVMEQLWSKGCEISLYTGFAYGTAYESIDDWYNIHFLSTVMNPKVLSNQQSTPSKKLDWSNRVRLPVPTICREKQLTKHILYHALGCHISQAAYRRSTRIINSDQVFWYRGPHCYRKIEYIQILVNGNFTYDFICYKHEAPPVMSVYVGNRVDGFVISANDKRLQWYVNDMLIEDGRYETILHYMESVGCRNAVIRCVWCDNPSIINTILMRQASYLQWLKYGWWHIMNYIHYQIDHYKRKKQYKKLRSLIRPFLPLQKV